jgi:4-hydroxybenzoate polyprenyltransferase
VVVLTGQLSIGWSNDWLDAARDRAVGRAGKPVVSGMVPVPLLRAAALVALLVSLGLSVMLGPAAALLNALVVGGGWAYNAGLKATLWSWAPYAVAFGALPVLVATGMQAPVPAPGLVVAVALLAVAVHLANALPDLDDDEATGVRGLPQRIGVRGCTIAAPVLLLVAALGGLLAAGATAVVVTVTLVGLGAAAGIAIVLGGRARTARAAYRVVLLMAVVVLVTVILAAGG